VVVGWGLDTFETLKDEFVCAAGALFDEFPVKPSTSAVKVDFGFASLIRTTRTLK